MKIKTITCHDVYNLGASLQAYALVEYLKQLGHDVEIIDYKPEYLQHYKLNKVNNPKYDKVVFREIYLLLKLPERLKARKEKRKQEFDNFTKKFLPLTRKSYYSNEELKNDIPEADIYLAGSDQIWNTLFKNGKDPAFYLDFAPKESIKASYAASFATEDISEEQKPQIKRWLECLDYISVRETSGMKIINNLGIKGGTQVLDPVFLLNQDEWRKIEIVTDFKEPYLLVYDFDKDNKIREFVIKKAKEKKLKIYSVLPCEYCDKSFENEGPQTFLSLIDNAEYVISNSFHGTAFAIIFKKPFAVFDRKENINTRMQDLVKNLQLKSVVEKTEYKNIEPILKEEIFKSKEYISRVLRKKEVALHES